MFTEETDWFCAVSKIEEHEKTPRVVFILEDSAFIYAAIEAVIPFVDSESSLNSHDLYIVQCDEASPHRIVHSYIPALSTAVYTVFLCKVHRFPTETGFADEIDSSRADLECARVCFRFDAAEGSTHDVRQHQLSELAALDERRAVLRVGIFQRCAKQLFVVSE